ncbi:Plasmodium vivax Vir protein, putative [Plasmodium vivax]|uniref:Vir protein, putative n=1 Tax=Plasmodium vivax TaxID=5855 RepID=A0A1G4E6I5_PLAVI|nr:Plasmodium vivax Vir protein, putative [Plasmodium vivax]
MQSSSRSKDFSQLFRSSPKELYSEKFYYAMDVDSEDLNNYNKTCDEIWVREPKDQMILICKKYLRFLHKSESWSVAYPFYDISLLLNYWIYDNLSRIYGDNNTDAIDLGFGALQGKWDTHDRIIRDRSYYEKCRPEPRKVNHEDWKNRKKLYDFYVDYDHLFLMAQIYHDKCEYYEKIKEMIPVCAYFKGKCSSGKYNCPDYFNKCEVKDLNSALQELPCHNTIKTKSVRTSEDGFSHRASDHTERPVDHAGGPTAKSDTQLEIGNSVIGKKVAHSVLGAAPVLLTATALYRVPGFVGSVEAEQTI